MIVKKVIQWGFVIFPIFLLCLILVKLTGFYVNSVHSPLFFQGSYIGHVSGHHFGHHAAGRFHESMHTSYLSPPSMLMNVFKIALALAGLAIWKLSKEKLGKLVGGMIFSFASFILLPAILGIPFLLVMGYLGYKAFYQEEEQPIQPLRISDSAIVSQFKKRDFLDEWEQSVRKEEQ